MMRADAMLALLAALLLAPRLAAAADLSRLAVVGDSLAVGVGSGDPGDPARRTAYPTRIAARAGSDLLNAAVSGARVADALEQIPVVEAYRPTTIVVFIGSNDALAAAVAADPALLTPPDRFRRDFEALMTRLARTGAALVVATLPDVTRVPHVTASRDLGARIGRGAADVSIRRTVGAFNAAIGEAARARGALLVDVHGLLDRVHAHGYPLAGRLLTTRPGGGLFSNDQVHPTATGQAILANAFIDAMNAGLGTRLPRVDIEAVAADDPALR